MHGNPLEIRQADVLVVGLGPAGASSAMAAAARGCSVIGIDRKARFGYPVQCAEYVPQALRAYGINSDTMVQGIKYMRSTLPSGRSHTMASPGIMLDRAQFDCALIARARQQGASLMNDVVLQRLDVDNRIAVIHTAAGRLAVHYTLLIAADGARSPVARLAKRPSLRTLKTQQYTVPLERASDTLDVRLSSQYPCGYGWLFPKGELANVGVGFVTHSAAELKQALQALLREWAEQGLVHTTIVSRTGGEIPVSGLRHDLARDHILFAGDAAGLTHPITGAGIAPAVISGQQAGTCAAHYIQGGNSAALSDYEETLKDVYGPVLSRALHKREVFLTNGNERQRESDEFLRQYWAGFPEYFH